MNAIVKRSVWVADKGVLQALTVVDNYWTGIDFGLDRKSAYPFPDREEAERFAVAKTLEESLIAPGFEIRYEVEERV